MGGQVGWGQYHEVLFDEAIYLEEHHVELFKGDRLEGMAKSMCKTLEILIGSRHEHGIMMSVPL